MLKLTVRSAAVVTIFAVTSFAFAGAADRPAIPPATETLPRTEQIESGQTTMQQLTDRQLTAFLIDLTQRVNYDRQQHNGVVGHDSSYLLDWTAKISDEMKSRGLGADDQGTVSSRLNLEK